MELYIEDFSIESAIVRFREEVEGGPEGVYKIVNLNGRSIDRDIIDTFEGNGHVVFCYTEKETGPNTNKSQFSTVEHHVFKGTKKWVTKYLAVYDTPNSLEVVPESGAEMKGDCVTKAREASEKTKRDTFVVLGKSPEGFKRLQSTIKYKPSNGQKPGRYRFIW